MELNTRKEPDQPNRKALFQLRCTMLQVKIPWDLWGSGCSSRLPLCVPRPWYKVVFNYTASSHLANKEKIVDYRMHNPLIRIGFISIWNRNRQKAGDEWKCEIFRARQGTERKDAFWLRTSHLRQCSSQFSVLSYNDFSMVQSADLVHRRARKIYFGIGASSSVSLYWWPAELTSCQELHFSFYVGATAISAWWVFWSPFPAKGGLVGKVLRNNRTL